MPRPARLLTLVRSPHQYLVAALVALGGSSSPPHQTLLPLTRPWESQASSASSRPAPSRPSSPALARAPRLATASRAPPSRATTSTSSLVSDLPLRWAVAWGRRGAEAANRAELTGRLLASRRESASRRDDGQEVPQDGQVHARGSGTSPLRRIAWRQADESVEIGRASCRERVS